MIPRQVKRLFDERGEPREASLIPAEIDWRGAACAVRVLNVSRSGAMLLCGEIPNIGERVVLRFADEEPLTAIVCWVRDGRIGLHFAPAVG